MRFMPLFLLPLAFAFLAAQAPEGEALCQQAETALFQHHVGQSRQLLEQAVQILPPGEKRAQAEVQLAVLAWRYRRDGAEAALRYQEAAAGLPPWRLALVKARWRREEGDLAGALGLYREALARAATEEDRTTVRKAALHVLARLLRPGKALAASDLDFLRDQAKGLQGSPDCSRVEWQERLDLALVTGDGRQLLAAWAALNPRDESGAAQPLPDPLPALLPRYQGAGSLSPEQQLQLVQALAAARLHPEAAWLAQAAHLKAPAAQDERAYAQFLLAAQDCTETYYRQVAMDQGDRGIWRDRFLAAERELIAGLDWNGRPAPRLGRKRMERELRARFGAYLNFGTSGGVYDLHFGHVVRDVAWVPSQYGHTLGSQFHLVTLAFEVSNGYESWLWDGRAAHGGWSNSDAAIYQWAADSQWGARLWSARMEQPGLGEWRKEQARLDARDAARPRTEPLGNLEGERRRLEAKGADLLLANLRARGLEGAALREAFIRICEQSRHESTIVAHEGRHALDKDSVWTRLRLTFQWSRGLEYRAKLSEIALAPIPYFAFGGILTANAGDATPHGQANARLLKGMAAWVDAHAAEIPGYAGTRPAWLQLDLLSADQLRAAARSLDPWARD